MEIKKIISRKNIVSFLITGLIIGAGILGLRKFKTWQDKSKKIYEAAVQVRDQKNSNPKEDARTCFKKGDVVLILPEGHKWSKTERVSYLILKMKLTKDQAQKLVSSVKKKVKKAKQENKDKKNEKEMEPEQEEIVRLRKYRIRLEKLKFNPEDLIKGQPFKDKIFDWSIVEKK